MKIKFVESTERIRNPEMGYPTFGCWQHMHKDGIGDREKWADFNGYTNQLYTLTAFTENGGGKDILITDAALSALGDQLSILEKNGGVSLLRFSYDCNGKRDMEPTDFSLIGKHLEQIGEVLKEHSCAVAGLEAGIIGVFGEMHSSKYCAAEYAKPIIQSLLDACPDKKPVLLRTPAYLKSYTGLDYGELAKWTPEEGSDAARIGFFNDGYMGSDSDLGTWCEDTMTRKEGIDYLNRTGHRSFYGGEYSGAWWWTTRFHTWLPENAIPEMYRSHVDYVRGNVFNDSHVSYSSFIYGPEYERPWFPDNSAYYGETCYRFIVDHLGYRFVLRASYCAGRERKLVLSGKVENTGFSTVINPKKSSIILKSQTDGETYRIPLDFDIRDWKSCKTTDYSFNLDVPENTPKGRYDVYFSSTIYGINEEAERRGAIRFANPDLFDEELGANYIGCANIGELKA